MLYPPWQLAGKVSFPYSGTRLQMKLQFSFSVLLSFHLAPNVLQDSVMIGEIKENGMLAIRSAFDNKTTKNIYKILK